MKRLGIVGKIIYNGLILVSAEHVPDKDAMVIDARMNPVGRVIRVFGPVKSPYVTIFPANKDTKTLLNLIGKEVYLKEVYGNAKTKKDRRK